MWNALSRAVPALCLLLVIAPASVGRASVGPRAWSGGASLPRAWSGPVAAGPGAGPSFPSGASVVGGSATRFRWPLAGTPQPVRRFDPPPQPWLPGHRGVDLAAIPGAAVHAAGPGVVLFAGPVAGRPVVTVGHADGLRTTYEPVRPGLPAGARVEVGRPIGTLLAGHPGCPAEACLHWGLRRGDEYLDPLALLGLGPVRLLPLDPADHTPSGAAPGVTAAQTWASSAGRRTASRSYSSGVL